MLNEQDDNIRTRQILIVDDQKLFREGLRSLFEDNDLEVIEAADGGEAKSILAASNDIDLVLSDIRMPVLNGIELLHWMREHHKAPIVLMTGFTGVIEQEEAIELGARHFLAKPFSIYEIMHIVREVLDIDIHPKEDGVKVEPDFRNAEDFLKVDLKNFVSGNLLPCGIYIRLNRDKFVKLANAGADVPEEAIERYRTSGVRHLFVRKDDYREFLGLNLQIADALRQRPDIEKQKIRNFVKYTYEILLENTFMNEIDADLLEETKDYVKTSMELISDDHELMTLLMSLNENSDRVYAHSLGSALLAVSMTKKLGWTSPKTRLKMFLCGLLHDVGLKEVNREIIDKSRALWTADEVAIFESHASRGLEIIQSLKTLPEEVALAVYQHHEDCTGGGFPQGLKKHQILPLSRILSVIDIFCTDYEEDGAISDMENLRQKLLKAERMKGRSYDPKYLNALKEVLCINVPKKRAMGI